MIRVWVWFLCLVVIASSAVSQILPFPGSVAVSGGSSGNVFKAAQFGSNQTGTSVTTVPTGSVATTTGWKAIVVTRVNNSISAPTDTAGNTYTLIPGSAIGTGGYNLELAYAENITGNAANIVNCNFTSNAFADCVVVYFSGGALTSIIDTSAGSTSVTGSSVTSNSFTTAAANEVIVACGSYNNVGSTWVAGLIGGVSATLPANGNTGGSGSTGCEYLITSTSQTGITAAIGVNVSQSLLGVVVAAVK